MASDVGRVNFDFDVRPGPSGFFVQWRPHGDLGYRFDLPPQPDGTYLPDLYREDVWKADDTEMTDIELLRSISATISGMLKEYEKRLS